MNEVMLFNGTSSKVDCGSYDTLVGDKSIVIWNRYLQPKNISADKFIFSNGQFKIDEYNNRIYVTSNNSTYINTGGILNLYNEWKNVVITRTSTGITNIYINGVLTGSANQSSGTPVAGTAMVLGADGAVFFKNQISSVRIIDGLLTPAEINSLYTSEKIRYGL